MSLRVSSPSIDGRTLASGIVTPTQFQDEQDGIHPELEFDPLSARTPTADIFRTVTPGVTYAEAAKKALMPKPVMWAVTTARPTPVRGDGRTWAQVVQLPSASSAALDGDEEIIIHVATAAIRSRTPAPIGRWTPVHELVKRRRMRYLDTLIAEGYDINSGDPDGWTPLMLAVYYRFRSGVEALLNAGADEELVNMDGYTAAALARAIKSPVEDLLCYDEYASAISDQKMLAHIFGINGKSQVADVTFDLGFFYPPIVTQVLADHLSDFFDLGHGHDVFSGADQHELDKLVRMYQNPLPAHAIRDRLRSGKAVILQGKWEIHFVAIVFIENIMVICDRDDHEGRTIRCFYIDLERITGRILREIRDVREADSREGRMFFISELPMMLESSFEPFPRERALRRALKKHQPKRQKGPFCALTSQKAALQVVAQALVMSHHGKRQFPSIARHVRETVKLFFTYMRIQALRKYCEKYPESAGAAGSAGSGSLRDQAFAKLEARREKHSAHFRILRV